MKIIKREEHRVTSNFTYNIPDEHIIEIFGSLERFIEIASHNNTRNWDAALIGEEPADEESDNFYECFCEYESEREDDWWTETKGSFTTSYEVINESDVN